MTLYIDPGTGSMLFTILLGVIGAGIYSMRMLLIKIKFAISGGKVEVDANKIPFVIYSDDKRYWNIFAPICKEMNKRGKDIVYLTSSEDDPVFESGYEHVQPKFIGEDNKAFAHLNFLNANILLSTTPGLDVYQWKKSKEVDCYIHMFHAPNDVTLYRMFGIDYYDSILVSGAYQEKDIRALEAMRNLPAKDIHTIGIPYMDVMAERLKNVVEQETQNAADVKVVEKAKTPTVLLAPSWGPSAIFAVYGGKIIEKLLATGYHVIVRPHPQSFKSEKEMLDKLMAEFPESDQLEWNRDNDNFEVLRRSDILISDFSGVIFDFALIYDKPVIYTDPKFDLSPYDAWWMETPLWTLSALPRLGKELTEENMDNISELIDACLNDPSYETSRQSVKAETWEYRGQGAERTVDYLLRKYEEVVNGKKVK